MMSDTFLALPFGGLLLAIALIPLKAPHFWERNWNKFFVSMAFSLPVIAACFLEKKIDLVTHSTLEYLSFISLLASLYTCVGGIHLWGDIAATPKNNTLFLLLGAVLANFIGTTGASMLLIRPLLITNHERKNTRHLSIFFIIVVSNMGGLLTPLGDPPLFLGFLHGVPFFWTSGLWPIWLVANGLVLILFYLWDRRAYSREAISAKVEDFAEAEPLLVRGRRNFLLLAVVIGAVFLPSPVREFTMIAAAVLSHRITPREIYEKNRFNWHPIVEVAVLFAGIFLTMGPALELLKTLGPRFPLHEPWHYFWLTGLTSSFLDNAPTYLTFFTLGQGAGFGEGQLVAGVPETILVAISCGAVFMGANTYIGNGPNFMVKAISDQMGVRTPSFFGYTAYSFGILLPIYLLVTWLFF